MYTKSVFVVILTVTKIYFSETLQFEWHPDRDLTILQILHKYGYTVEIHTIITDDGYILTAYRIPHGRKTAPSRPNPHPVLMVHGTCGCSENFIVAGPGKATAYYLADKDFDIWLLNTRGNRHSRKHVTLNPDSDTQYWDFGWHEIGVYDIPSAIDYILEITNKTALFYIGHSRGSTSYFAFASEKTEYNKKIKVAVTMAPSCLIADTRSFLKVLGKHAFFIENIAKFFNFYELFPNPYNDLINSIAKLLCSETSIMIDICRLILTVGDAYGDMDVITPQVALNTSPARCSTKELIHYFQILHSDAFRQFDYGPKGNLKIYGNKSPPLYSFSNMTAPIALFYAPQDTLCVKKGVLRMAKLLPNLAMQYEVPSNNFGHADFIFGKSIVELVNKPMYKLFKKYLKDGV